MSSFWGVIDNNFGGWGWVRPSNPANEMRPGFAEVWVNYWLTMFICDTSSIYSSLPFHINVLPRRNLLWGDKVRKGGPHGWGGPTGEFKFQSKMNVAALFCFCMLAVEQPLLPLLPFPHNFSFVGKCSLLSPTFHVILHCKLVASNHSFTLLFHAQDLSLVLHQQSNLLTPYSHLL